MFFDTYHRCYRDGTTDNARERLTARADIAQIAHGLNFGRLAGGVAASHRDWSLNLPT